MWSGISAGRLEQTGVLLLRERLGGPFRGLTAQQRLNTADALFEMALNSLESTGNSLQSARIRGFMWSYQPAHPAKARRSVRRQSGGMRLFETETP